MNCPRCGTALEGDQNWCTECGLAARTRLARTPNWQAPLIAAAVVGLGAIVALIVAFVVLTGDNAPLPQTAAATAPPADTVPTTTTTIPAATTPIPTTVVATTTIPPATSTPATTSTPTPTTTAELTPGTTPTTGNNGRPVDTDTTKP